MNYKKIEFPKDELAHRCIVEWWYFNSNLEDKKGNLYSFMNCLFKVDNKRVNIPFLKRIPINPLFFSHSILSDISKKKVYASVNYISFISKDSFTKPLLFINYFNPSISNRYFNCEIVKNSDSLYRLKTEFADLSMAAEKKALLIDNKGFFSLCKRSSYYYSLPRLRTDGVLDVNGKRVEVSGLSWMDHQWANVKFQRDKWSWMCIHLDSKDDIVCFEYEVDNKKKSVFNISYGNSKSYSTYDVVLTPLKEVWRSNKTNCEYILSWKVVVQELNLFLEVFPLVKEQEIIFGTINYWEGPIKVSGFIGEKKVQGYGFLELVGYPSKYNGFLFAKDELMKIKEKIFLRIKKKIYGKFTSKSF